MNDLSISNSDDDLYLASACCGAALPDEPFRLRYPILTGVMLGYVGILGTLAVTIGVLIAVTS